MKITEIIFRNFLAKIISLILAIATWFYIFDLVNIDSFSQKEQTVEDIFSRYEFTAKKVPVKPLFSGKSPKGYRAVFEKVKITPGEITIFGPGEIVETVSELRTGKINLGEYTRSASLRLGVSSDSKFFKLEEEFVDVYLPVEAEEVKE
ncbi:MAG: YbbR-like domain-containing protein [Candidatus Omnitrophota bacterium]